MDEKNSLAEDTSSASHFYDLTGRDGAMIHVYAWLPSGEPRGVIQIIHGMAEHAARYRELAKLFQKDGFAVYAHDQRGHGETGRSLTLGHLADEKGWALAVDDCVRLARQTKLAGKPHVLLAHSMGSFMAQQILYQHRDLFDGVALSGSAGKPPAIAKVGRLVARAERKRVGRRSPSPLLQKLSFGDYNNAFKPNRTEFDWLSRDPEQVDAYIFDPLCGFPVSTTTWVELLDALPKLADPINHRLLNQDTPIYVFSGAEDPIGERGASVERLVAAYRKAGVKDVSMRLYPKGRHEMLNETNKAEVMSDLQSWIEQVCKAFVPESTEA